MTLWQKKYTSGRRYVLSTTCVTLWKGVFEPKPCFPKPVPVFLFPKPNQIFNSLTLTKNFYSLNLTMYFCYLDIALSNEDINENIYCDILCSDAAIHGMNTGVCYLLYWPLSAYQQIRQHSPMPVANVGLLFNFALSYRLVILPWVCKAFSCERRLY